MTKINIIGLNSLNAKLKKLHELGQHPDAILAGAFVIEKYAKQKAPVDTGALRSSITSRKTEDGADVFTQVQYAYYQEFGSSRNRAHPFMRPAVDEHGDDAVFAVKRALKKLIAEEVG